MCDSTLIPWNKERCYESKIGHGESEEEQNRRETRFLRLWGACQPTLFAEWEREMDRLEAKEEKRRQEQAGCTRRARPTKTSEGFER